MSSFEEAAAALSPGSLVRACWEEYWFSLAVAAAWLLYVVWSRSLSRPGVFPRARQNNPGAPVSVSPLVLCVWGVDSTLVNLGNHGIGCFAGPTPTWHYWYFLHWLDFFHSMLALLGIGGALLLAHWLRRGGQLQTSVLASASIWAIVLTVIVDWLFGLFVVTPFECRVL